MKLKNKIKFSTLALIISSSILSFNFTSSAAEAYTRINGADRYETSIKTAEYMRSDVLVLANGKSFPDALSAVNICNKEDAKLLLVNGSEDLSEFVKEGDFKKVYIVGGESLVSSDFENNLENTDADVVRLAGVDRYATNKSTLTAGEYSNVGVADGTNYADALSSSRFLKEKELGLLLINPKNASIDEEFTVDYIFGGVNSVPDLGQGQRIAGKDRYDTSINIAQATQSENITFTSGKDFADALSSVNLANAKDSDIVLTPIKKDNRTELLSKNAKEIFVVGGQASLWESSVVQAIEGTVVNPLNNKYGYISLDGKNYLVNLITNERVNYQDTDNGLINIPGSTYALNADGSIINGWVDKNGVRYYSELKTGFVKGWKRLNSKLYYFSPSDYHMYSGNIIQSTGEGAYWFGPDGAVKTGRKASGRRGKSVYWAGPSNYELENHWITAANPQARFRGQEIVNFAMKFDGLPFKWYGSDLRDRGGVYCCGAVYSAYKEFGIRLPGPNDMNPRQEGGYIMVRQQYQRANEFGFRYMPTNFNTMWPGDINYSSAGRGRYSHAAMYIGKNNGRPMTIHATLADGLITEPFSIVNSWGYYYLNTLRYNR